MSYRIRMLAAIQKAQDAGLLKGGLYHTLVKHDDRCPCTDGYGGEDRCTCDPDIEIISTKEFLRRQRRGQL